MRVDLAMSLLAGIGLVLFGGDMVYMSLLDLVRQSRSAVGFLTTPINLILTGYGLSILVAGALLLARRSMTCARVGAVPMWPIVVLAALPAVRYGDGSAARVAAIALVVAALTTGVWFRRRSIDGSI